MAKPQFQSNPRVHQIFDDLEKLKKFAVDYGYKYDENDLYNMRSYVYRQYSKLASGKQPKNFWKEDGKSQQQ